jgi:cytochrome c biogenesis protein ResB
VQDRILRARNSTRRRTPLSGSLPASGERGKVRATGVIETHVGLMGIMGGSGGVDKLALFEALAFEAEVLGTVVAAAQSGHVVREGAEEFEVLAFIHLAGQLAGGEGVAGGEEGGEMVGDVALAGLGEAA